MESQEKMLSSTKLCLFYITLLEIAMPLVMGTDYGAANTLNGNVAIDTQNQDIIKDQAIPVSNFLQNPSNFAPNSHKETENHEINARDFLPDENSILNLHSSIIENNLLKENPERNIREVFDTDSNIDTKDFDTDLMFDTKISHEDTCYKESPNRITREVFDTDSRRSDTEGFMFDTNEDKKQDTCLREDLNRNTREVFDSGSVSSNILNTLKDTNCFEDNSKRNARQVIDSNISNQPIQDSEQEIPRDLTLNGFNGDGIQDNTRNVREALNEGSGEVSKLTKTQDDIPIIPNKLGISTNLAPDTLDGNQNFKRNVRGVGNIEQNLNQNLQNVEPNHRNLREIDNVAQIPNQNLKIMESNQVSDGNNQRIVRNIDNTLPVAPISNNNLENLDSNQKIDGNNNRNSRETQGPTIESSDLSRQDTFEENSHELGILSNLQKFTKSDSFEDGTNLKENLRNSGEIIGVSQVDLNRGLKQDNHISGVEIGLPSYYASNSDGILKENVERNAREIQGPSLFNSENVSNQNMDENEGKYIENNQIIVGENVQRNAREIQDSSLKDSDTFDQNMNENGVEPIENVQRIARGAFDESENVNESNERNTREISDVNGMFRPNILEENALNSGSNSEDLVEMPEHLDPTLFRDDESLVENNMRNIREVGDIKSIEDEANLDEKDGNFERKVREISDGSENFGSNHENIDGNRNIRDIPDLSENVDLQVSTGKIIEENRNIREIPDSSRKLDFEASEEGKIGEQRNIREISDLRRKLDLEVENRNIREISEDNPSFEPNSSDQGAISNEPRNVRELSVKNPSLNPNSFNQEYNNDEPRNIREIFVEYPSLKSNSLNQDFSTDEPRNIREISVENPSLKSNSLNQEFNTDEPRNIREVSVQNSTGFNPDIYKQEPVIIGEGRNVREISSDGTGFKNEFPQQEPIVIGGDRTVRDIDIGETSSFNKKDENKEMEEESDTKREARSCKKKNSHHKNNTSNEFVYEKPEPVRASLQMMNVRIVKSKDDSKFLDEATDSNENTGGENVGKKKKKKICRVKNLHVLQPLKKNSKILESPRKKQENNLRNFTTGSFLKVLKATLDKNEGEDEEGEGEGEGEEEEEGVDDEERELEDESGRSNNEEEEVDENNTKSKPAKKSKMNFDRSNVKSIKDRGRLEGKIISSPLVAENVPKRVFGGTKKFVLGENHPQNFAPKNRKSLFKKERLKNDEPTFLVGLEIKKNLKKEMEEDGIESNDDSSSSKVEDNIDEPCQSVVGISGNFERLKLKDLQNFSEPINVSLNNKRKNTENKLNFKNKLNNFDKIGDNFDKNRDNYDKNVESDEPEVMSEEEGEEGGKQEEEEEEGEEEEVGLKRREKDDDEEESENNVGVENDEFEENMDMGEARINENWTD